MVTQNEKIISKELFKIIFLVLKVYLICKKKLTPQQMLIRLPISLTQLKAANNSEKLKNEIRQLLYSLYR